MAGFKKNLLDMEVLHRLEQMLDLGTLSFDDNFYSAISEIPHRTLVMELLGNSSNGDSEANALNATIDLGFPAVHASTSTISLIVTSCQGKFSMRAPISLKDLI